MALDGRETDSRTTQAATDPGAYVDVVTRLERLPFTRRHWRTAGVLGVGTIFDAFDDKIISSIVPVLAVSLALSSSTTGFILSVTSAGEFVGALVVGRLSEAIGRKKTYLGALFLFGLLSLTTAWSWNLESLTIMRFLAGIGLGAEVPIAAALFNEIVKAHGRGKVVAIYETLFPWGNLLAPLVALGVFAAVGDTAGWRVLLLIGAIPLVVAVIGWFALPESPRWLLGRGRTAEALDEVSRFEQSAARGTRSGADHSTESAGEPDASAIRVPADGRTRIRELFSPTYRRRTIVNWIHWFSTYFVLTGFTLWLPSLYVKLGHLSVTRALVLTVISSLVGLASSYFFAFVVDRIGRKILFATGFFIGAFGALLGIILGYSGAAKWVALFVAFLVIQTGLVWNNTGLYLYTPELFPTRMRALATATGSSANRIAKTVAPLLISAILAAGWGQDGLFVVFGVIAVGAGIMLALLGIETKGKVLEELAP
jgi:putative MFS transporter